MSAGIKYIGYWDDTGYGHASKAYLEGLSKRDISLTWQPARPTTPTYIPKFPPLGQKRIRYIPECMRPAFEDDPPLDAYYEHTLRSLIKKEVAYDTVIAHSHPEYWYEFTLREPGKRHIGMTVWETTRLPEHWPDVINVMDKVLVPSAFCRQALQESGVKRPIDVIPHISRPRLPGKAPPLPDHIKDRFVVYTISTWTVRKAIWDTLHAYLRAFTPRDDTVLIIKTGDRGTWEYNGRIGWFDTQRLVQEIIATYKNPAPVITISHDLSDNEVAGLHEMGDCFISLTHSEGWGLGPFDAARYCNPVVVTGWGGQLDYLPPDLAWLVDYKLIAVEDKFAPHSYSPDQQWAQADLSDAVDKLRWVYEHRASAASKATKLNKLIVARYNEEVVTERLLAAL